MKYKDKTGFFGLKNKECVASSSAYNVFDCTLFNNLYTVKKSLFNLIFLFSIVFSFVVFLSSNSYGYQFHYNEVQEDTYYTVATSAVNITFTPDRTSNFTIMGSVGVGGYANLSISIDSVQVINQSTTFNSGSQKTVIPIFHSTNFTQGVEYTVSLDVVPDNVNYYEYAKLMIFDNENLYYNESLDVSSTTSTNFVEKSALYPVDANTYFLMCSYAQTRSNVTGGTIYASSDSDYDSVISDWDWQTGILNSAGAYQTFFACSRNRFGSTSSSYRFKNLYKIYGTGTTAYIRESRNIAINFSDISLDGSTDINQTNTGSSTTSTIYQNSLILNHSTTPGVDYVVMAFARIKPIGSGNGFKIKLTDNDTTESESEYFADPAGENSWIPFFSFYNFTAASSSHTAKIQYASQISGRTAEIDNMRLFAFPVSTSPISFSNYARNPNPPNEDQNIQVNVTISNTPDTVLLEWEGTKNYTVTTHNGQEYYFTIGSSNYTAHDSVTYYWYANDSGGTMEKSAQQSFTVSNQIPTVGEPTVNDTTPETDDTLSCNGGTFSDNDAEDSETSREFQWYDDDSIISGQTSQTLSLSVANLDKNDVIKCSVRVSDSYDWSSWVNSSNSATIQNTAPTMPSPDSLSEDNYTIDDTPFFNWTISTDADDDTITYGIDIATDTVFSNIVESNYSLTKNNYTSSALGDDTYYWRVKAITSDANSSYTAYRTFTIDTSSPLWKNQGQNISVIKVGDSVKLYAQGYDLAALNQAWLATNETGVWENKTYYVETTIQLKDADTENLGDSTVISDHPTTNYGSDTEFDVEVTDAPFPNSERRSYIKFNISQIPINADLVDIELCAYTYTSFGTKEFPIYKVYNSTYFNESCICRVDEQGFF